MTRRTEQQRGAPPWIPPQLASLTADAPAGDDWVHEIKYDGYRLLAGAAGGVVQLLTRNRKDWTGRFTEVADGVRSLGLDGTLLDGEVAVEGPGGVTDFQALQNVLNSPAVGTVQFFVFDLLYLSGEDLRGAPLVERKERLRQVLAEAPPVLRYSDHVVGRGAAFFSEACQHGLEGIISKRASAPYRPGRGLDWRKVKCVREQEFVIGGFTEPGGSRQDLGALHVGARDDDGRLIYRGKVGTGFTASALRDLRRRLAPLERPRSPFSDGPTGGAARGSHWVEPQLVARIRFTEITGDGRLRHPAFDGLREDKDAAEVRLELPAAPGPAEPPGADERAAPAKPAARTSRESAKSRRTRSGRQTEFAGVRLTSPAKVLYPEQGVTKLELAQYYEAVANWMLPHVRARPLTLVRCPAGRGSACFFQKHIDETTPEAVRRVLIEERDGPEWYGMIDSLAGLVSLTQIGALELHTFNSRADRLERPDRFILDLDPDEGLDWADVVEAALHVRDVLAELGLTSFVKTTGGKGLHVAVPLVRRTGWDEVRTFSRAVASLLARAAPDRYTTEMSKRKRRGRLLLDYLRNARGSTAIEAYSTRARAGAPVAAPIHWGELLEGVRSDTFTVRTMPERLETLGEDPWKEFGAVKQSITAPMKRRVGL